MGLHWVRSSMLFLGHKNMASLRILYNIKCFGIHYLFHYFLSMPFLLYFMLSQIHRFGSIDLKRMQAEIPRDVLPSSSRSPNHIALRFFNLLPTNTVRWNSIHQTILLLWPYVMNSCLYKIVSNPYILCMHMYFVKKQSCYCHQVLLVGSYCFYG